MLKRCLLSKGAGGEKVVIVWDGLEMLGMLVWFIVTGVILWIWYR